MIIQSLSQISSATRPKYLVVWNLLQENLEFKLARRKSQIRGSAITIILHLTHAIASRPIRLLFRIDATVPKELLSLNPNNRYLIVCNHQQRIDPCLVLAALPYKSILAISPIRFFTANKLLRFFWQRLALGMFGSFRAHSTNGKISGVRGGLRLSDKGHTLFIFPQGKIRKNKLNGGLKVGIGYLVKRRNFIILPAYLSSIKGSSEGTTCVRWGKPFSLSPQEIDKDLSELTDYIFSHVTSLSDR